MIFWLENLGQKKVVMWIFNLVGKVISYRYAGKKITKLLYMDIEIEPISKCRKDGKSQFSYCWRKKLQIREDGGDKGTL